MSALVYPKKPWTDGQKATLIPGMQFIYSASMRKWVPITPGFTNETQIQEAFGVRTVEEVDTLFTDVGTLKEQIVEFGRIWKTDTLPQKDVYPNDVWIEPNTGKMFFFLPGAETWVEINFNKT